MNTNKYVCHDCGKELEVKNEEIKDGFTLVYDNDGEKIEILKCKECYEKNPKLVNFRECEVYSRIVGYIRPVRQWNVGKKVEYNERKEFIVEPVASAKSPIGESSCCS